MIKSAWILIIIFYGYEKPIEVIHFGDEKSCMIAKNKLENPTKIAKIDNRRKNFYCVKTGLKND